MNPSDRKDPLIHPWQTLQDEEIADCRIFSVRSVTRASPTGEAKGNFFYIASADWVNVVALSADGRLVLIRQFRHGSDEITLEIPGGIIDEGESPTEAARRELLEETGFAAEKLEVIGRVRSNPAIISNWTWTVLATGLGAAASATMFDEHEEISVELIDVHEIDEKLRNGEITHALVVGAIMWYRLYQQRQVTSGDI
jgi:8-oxo-dGTP pyrophosphatase MutT (NUDIX family)